MWQLIETAPKDGTSILIYDGDSCYVVFWGQSDNAHWDTGEYDDVWILDSSRSKETHNFSGTPTHWMPLPEKP